MKRLAQFVICVVTLVSVATPVVCGPKPPFSLSIAAPKEPTKAGAELYLRITLTNTSDRYIVFARSPGPIPEEAFRYEIDVRDAQGHSAPPSAYVRELEGKPTMTSSSNLSYTLKPSDSFIDQVTVTRFYDLSQPGTYTISVARPIPPRQNLGEGKVKSNSVTVTVVTQ